MAKLVFTRPDGGVSIVIPATGVAVEELMEKSIPEDATNVRQIEDSDIPASREFRDAWCDTEPGTQIDIDVEKAKQCQINNLNALRLEKIEALKTQGYLEDDPECVAINNDYRAKKTAINAINAVGRKNDAMMLQQIRDVKLKD